MSVFAFVPKSFSNFPKWKRGKPWFLVLEGKIPSVTTRGWRHVSIAKNDRKFLCIQLVIKKKQGGISFEAFFSQIPELSNKTLKRLFSDFDGCFCSLKNFMEFPSVNHSLTKPKLYIICVCLHTRLDVKGGRVFFVFAILPCLRGGGSQLFFSFSTKNLQKWIQFDEMHIISNGLVN